MNYGYKNKFSSKKLDLYVNFSTKNSILPDTCIQIVE